MTALEERLNGLEDELKRSMEFRGKLKEDLTLKDNEMFDLEREHQDKLRILEAQVRPFSFGRESMANEYTIAIDCRFWFLNLSAN